MILFMSDEKQRARDEWGQRQQIVVVKHELHFLMKLHPCPYIHLWSQDVGSDGKNKVQESEMRLIHKGAGLTLNNRVRSSTIQ